MLVHARPVVQQEPSRNLGDIFEVRREADTWQNPNWGTRHRLNQRPFVAKMAGAARKARSPGKVYRRHAARTFSPRLRLPYLLGYSSYLAGYDDWKYDGTICSNHVHHAAAEIRIVLPDPEKW